MAKDQDMARARWERKQLMRNAARQEKSEDVKCAVREAMGVRSPSPGSLPMSEEDSVRLAAGGMRVTTSRPPTKNEVKSLGFVPAPDFIFFDIGQGDCAADGGVGEVGQFRAEVNAEVNAEFVVLDPGRKNFFEFGAVVSGMKKSIEVIVAQRFGGLRAGQVSAGEVEKEIRKVLGMVEEPANLPERFEVRTRLAAGDAVLVLVTKEIAKDVFETTLWSALGDTAMVEEAGWRWVREREARMAHLVVASELRLGRDPTTLPYAQLLEMARDLDAQLAMAVVSVERAKAPEPQNVSGLDQLSGAMLDVAALNYGLTRAYAETDGELRARIKSLFAIPPSKVMQFATAEVFVNGEKVADLTGVEYERIEKEGSVGMEYPVNV